MARETEVRDGERQTGRGRERERKGEKDKGWRWRENERYFPPLLALEPLNELFCFYILKVIFFFMPAEINVY